MRLAREGAVARRRSWFDAVLALRRPGFEEVGRGALRRRPPAADGCWPLVNDLQHSSSPPPHLKQLQAIAIAKATNASEPKVEPTIVLAETVHVPSPGLQSD